MEDKCFCHLNGYAVKDAYARSHLEAMDIVIEELYAAYQRLQAQYDALAEKYQVVESQAIMVEEIEVVPFN